MKVFEIGKKINEIAKLGLALDWDNVGLLVGDGNKNVKSAILAIDVTSAVIEEAKQAKADMIISYHPVIWDGLKQVTSEGDGSVVYELIRAGLPVFSVHTALDISLGGVNDHLAKMVGIEDGQAIGDFVNSPSEVKYKLVTYVPKESLEKVTNAMFKAGAGWIGNYSRCGFSSKGVGSFKPLAGSKPYVGSRGKIEKVDEVRFETIVPAANIDACVNALKASHPYEECAYDVFRLYNDMRKFGLGRIGKLSQPVSIDSIVSKVKKATGAKAVGFVGNRKRKVSKAAVCAGSCGKIINQVISQGAELYLTGELKHHQAMAAQEAGLSCLCLSHSVSERFMLKIFAKELGKKIKGVKLIVSKKDKDPFEWKEI